MLSDEAQCLVDAVVRVAGGFGSGLPDIVEEIAAREHRTHQQSITRFCRAWLAECGAEDYETDGRNEASAELGKAFVEAGLSERPLPYV